MKLIIGLGNPGRQYSKTRHNAGFITVSELAKKYGFSEFKKSDKHNAELAEGSIDGEKAIIAKPQTFMNLSGQAVRSIMQFYKIEINDLVIISDDVTLPYGTLRVRDSGSAGGHNGLKSIIKELGTDEFLRIRLGIEPLTPFKGALEDYVLGQFSDEEKDLMGKNIEKLPELLKILFKKSIEEAMQEFN